MLIKLRFKFVGITFAVIMIITALILGLTVLENYIIVDNQINQILKIIDNNDLSADINLDSLSEDAIYATRYFSVVLDSAGNIQDYDLNHILAVDELDALSLAKTAYNSNHNEGYLEYYKFKIFETDSLLKIIFLDSSLQLNNLKSTAEAAIIIYMISMIIIFGLLVSISGLVLKPIEENIKKQKQFVTNAGHELKTPLAIINANLDVLEFELGEDNEWLLSLKNQTNRLNTLIKSLLSLSKYEYSKESQEVASFELNDLIQEEIENFKPMAKNKSIHFAKDQDIYLKTELETVRQLMDLFLDNAIKYTPENGFIRISALKQNKNLVISFYNLCENPQKINVKRIFERFYRGDKSHNTKIEGYGIGLSIVASIVEKYGGKIKVKKGNNNIEFILSFKNNKNKNFELI